MSTSVSSVHPVIRLGGESNDSPNPFYIIMHYVYLLLLKDNSIYKGRTDNLKARVIEHKLGKVKSTRNKRPLRLIHFECYLLKSDAVRREKYLKTTEGRRFLKQQLRDLFNQINKTGEVHPSIR